MLGEASDCVATVPMLQSPSCGIQTIQFCRCTVSIHRNKAERDRKSAAACHSRQYDIVARKAIPKTNTGATLRRRTPTELPLSTLGGLHVIPAEERGFGNVFQSKIRGRWELPGVFHCITGERLVVDADGRARWMSMT
jgi:hypothetical protein